MLTLYSLILAAKVTPRAKECKDFWPLGLALDLRFFVGFRSSHQEVRPGLSSGEKTGSGMRPLKFGVRPWAQRKLPDGCGGAHLSSQNLGS